MTARKGMLLAFAATVAVILNFVLFASAALLSRDRPVQDVAVDPVPVSLVTLKPPTPPPPEKTAAAVTPLERNQSRAKIACRREQQNTIVRLAGCSCMVAQSRSMRSLRATRRSSSSR